MRTQPGIRTPEQVAERLGNDPAARAELAQAREYRAETELSRGARHATSSLH